MRLILWQGFCGCWLRKRQRVLGYRLFYSQGEIKMTKTSLVKRNITIKGIKYDVEAFHPTAHERDVYAVYYYEHGKIKMDKYLDVKMTRAKSPLDAINKTICDVETESLRLAMANKKTGLEGFEKMIKVKIRAHHPVSVHPCPDCGGMTTKRHLRKDIE